MKFLYFFYIFLFCLSAKSQDLNKINNSSIVFIYFDISTPFVEKQTWGKVSKLDGKRSNGYAYFYNKKNFKSRGFYFVYNKYIDFDAAERNEKAVVFDVNKSFLRKNKSIILNTKMLKRIGVTRFINLFQGKRIFLIEKSINRKKITIREVVFYTEREE